MMTKKRLATAARPALLCWAMICAFFGVGAWAQAAGSAIEAQSAMSSPNSFHLPQATGEQVAWSVGAGAVTGDLLHGSSPMAPRTREAAPHDVDAEPIFVHCEFVDEIPVCGPASAGWWTADRAPAPLAAPAPKYPSRLLARGIEGWVVTELTVAEDGSVNSPKIVDAEPSDVFDAATLRAVARYRFPPPTVAGKPTAMHGVTVRVEFRIPKAGGESVRHGRHQSIFH